MILQLHATTLKQHMEEQKCNQQAEVRTNPDVMYIEQLIKQKGELLSTNWTLFLYIFLLNTSEDNILY